MQMNDLQAYTVYEYVADYKEGRLSRRDLVRRVLNITGGLGSTATLLLALGCAPSTTPPQPTAAPATAPKPTAPPASPAASPVVAKPAASPSPSPAVAASSPVAKPAASPAASPSPSPAAQSPVSVAANDPSIDGQNITFPGADGAMIMAYQVRPRNASGALPLVLVCHENRGLTEHIRDVTRRFAKENYTAVAVDLVSRQGGTAAITDPNQFSALITGQGVDQNVFVSDFRSAVEFYKTKPDLVQANKIAMVGYCIGGGIVWRSVTQIPDIRAAAPYYGPRPPADQVANIKASVLGVYSSDPMDFANNGRQELDQQLTAAGVDHKFNEYPGTRHAFHNDTGPAYNREQALAAWQDTLAWFRDKLA
jgi:carboxymethylenebutenolidase